MSLMAIVLAGGIGIMSGMAEINTTSHVRTIEANGAQLSYIEAGTGEPLIFVHGSTNDYREWEGQMEPFSKDFHVIAYSRRYHYPNQWDRADSAYTVEQHANDLIALIRAFGFQKVVLVAHSFGASVALVAATQHPELISKMVLAEPLMMLPDSAADSLKRDREDVERRVREALAKDDSIGALSAFGNWFGGALGWDQMPEPVRRRRLDNLASFKLQTAHVGGEPVMACADVQKIAVPVLLVQGELTKEFFKVATRDYAACLPNVQQAIIPGAGHGSVFQKPEEFNKMALGFLRSH